jgi:hypothetical protein
VLKPICVISEFDRANRCYTTMLITNGHRVVGETLSSKTKGGRDRDVRNLRAKLPQRVVELRVSGEEPHQVWQATIKELDGNIVSIFESTSRGALARDVYRYNANLPTEQEQQS